MEGYSRNEEVLPQLLELIPNGAKDRLLLSSSNQERVSEEKKLELRLAPPGDQDWSTNTMNNFKEKDGSNSLLTLGHFSNITQNTTSGSKRGFLETVADQKTIDQKNSWIKGIDSQNPHQGFSSPSSHYHHQEKSLATVMGKESIPQKQQSCCSKVLVVDSQNTEKKAFLPCSANNTAVPNSSQKRTAPAPVVGWPPIRSFRKNLANASKLPTEPVSQNIAPKKIEKQVENGCKGLFVKINMDGVPIGRKVDLKSYDSYDKLSCAVDELFRGLLAAQRDPSAGNIQDNQEGENIITGLLDGRGEYTLVYEDNEGDRMLVGDVPWNMFVSTVKRLRVLKSSELSLLRLGGSKQEKNPPDAALKG